MNILIVTYFFPPFNSIGSVRVGKFAKYLTESGHTVSVVAADKPALEQRDASLPVEIDPVRVRYTRWFDVNGVVRSLAGAGQHLRSNKVRGTAAVNPSLDAMSPGLQTLSKLYLSILNVPDAFWGWQPYGYRAAVEIARVTPLDVIIASGPPFSAFQVAARLSRRLNVPWVADFRDLWADKPHYPFLEWRRHLDLILERRALRTAAGMVMVSEPMQAQLSKRYPRVPSEVVLNGYDPGDYPDGGGPVEGLPLVVRYTGTLFYVGNSDPSLLFRALRELGPDRNDLRIEFVLRDVGARVNEMACDAGVADCVRVLPPVPYDRSLALQQESDVLAMILPLGPTWDHAFSGKFFEYCGAGRPILAIADRSNVAAQAVREHGLGLASTEPGEIADWLRARIAEKRVNGSIKAPDDPSVGVFSRRAQTRRLEEFIRTRLSPPLS